MGVSVTLPEPWHGPAPPTVFYLTTTCARVLGQPYSILESDAIYLLFHPHQGYPGREMAVTPRDDSSPPVFWSLSL